jgi:hypothetical protein
MITIRSLLFLFALCQMTSASAQAPYVIDQFHDPMDWVSLNEQILPPSSYLVSDPGAEDSVALRMDSR